MHLEQRVVQSHRIASQHGHCSGEDANRDGPCFLLQHGEDKDGPGRRTPPTDLLRHDIHAIPERIIVRCRVFSNRRDAVNEGQHVSQAGDEG